MKIICQAFCFALFFQQHSLQPANHLSLNSFSEGSVIAEFLIKMDKNYTRSESEDIAELVIKTLYTANNDTSTAFSRDYPISTLHVKPCK